MAAPATNIEMAKARTAAPEIVHQPTVDNNGTSLDGVDEKPAIKPARTTYPGLKGFFHWHEPGTSKEEKRLILKLDWFILSYSCLCFFIKWLDSNNVTNAWASGMSDDLGFGPG